MTKRRYRGESRPPTAGEINRWNHVANQQRRAPGHRAGFPTAQAYDPSSRVVFVENTSGSARDRFETMSVSGLKWDIATDGSNDVVFEADTADAAECPLVLIEPIANGKIGRAVIDGVALALVGGGTGSYATADAANHRLTPDDSGTIKLLIPPHATTTKLLPVVLGLGANTGIAKTGGSGIAGRTGAGTGGDPWVWGSATCTQVDIESGEPTTTTYTVYNSVQATIGADEVIQWKMIGGKRFVDVEGCS